MRVKLQVSSSLFSNLKDIKHCNGLDSLNPSLNTQYVQSVQELFGIVPSAPIMGMTDLHVPWLLQIKSCECPFFKLRRQQFGKLTLFITNLFNLVKRDDQGGRQTSRVFLAYFLFISFVYMVKHKLFA